MNALFIIITTGHQLITDHIVITIDIAGKRALAAGVYFFMDFN